MASLASSIRSAARATSSAYRRLPIRWRLAGGSAALTLVILCGFAAIVGVAPGRYRAAAPVAPSHVVIRAPREARGEISSKSAASEMCDERSRRQS